MKTLLPFMFGLLLAERLSRRALLHVQPIVRPGTPPSLFVNALLLAMTILGLGLSMRTWGALSAGK
jgi:hypothetical protein